jgi:hypothetical protein
MASPPGYFAPIEAGEAIGLLAYFAAQNPRDQSDAPGNLDDPRIDNTPRDTTCHTD